MNSQETHAWPKDTCGHRMTTKVPTARPEESLADVEKRMHEEIDHWKTINYIYVLDAERKLIGILSMKDLFRFPKSHKVGNVCKRDPLVEVKATSHQERAAYVALQHNIKAVPVVDHEHRFLGVLTSDTILTILYKEMHEDLLHLVGIQHPRAVGTNVLELSLGESFLHRFPWLFMGLIGGLVSAAVIGLFEDTLAENLILASFIPLVVYMSGAVAMQSQAYIIRDLALHHLTSFRRYLLRQFLVVSLIALAFGAVLATASYVLHSIPLLSGTLGLTLTIVILSSVFTGLLVPFAFSRLRMDPADASGPITTIVQDLLSVVIYLGVATWLL